MASRHNEQGVSMGELMVVVAIALIVIAMATPSLISTQRDFRALGDARDIAAEMLLAKMRAASDFTQVRAYFDTSAHTFRIEIWNKATDTWVVDAPSGTVNLSNGITFGFGAQTNPPPNTQAALGQATGCVPGTAGNPGGGAAIANTACVVFNSRGIPIDTTGSPTANDAVYITDGKGVYAVTVSATGLMRSWRIDVNDTVAAHWNQR